jgi:myo-inositol-1(or 4)-monophosphatase
LEFELARSMTTHNHPESDQIAQLLEFAIELSGVAGEAILPHFRASTAVSNKAATGFDPVTEADRSAESAIRDRIGRSFPHHGIIGEEFGTKPNDDNPWTWVLDPIDGTRAFICGTPTWMVLIGLLHNGRPVAGVAAQPFTGEVFVGSVPGGAFLLHHGKKSPLKTTAQQDIADVLCGTTGPHLYVEHGHAQRLERVRCATRELRFDADAYFHCMVAAGQLGLGLDTGLKIYDIAALIPIVEGAGGIVTTWNGGDACGGGDILVAGNAALHSQAMALLA